MNENTTNKSEGSLFERQLCEKLAEKGWWALNIHNSESGQPADIIAVKNNIAILIDAKVCQNGTFPLSRVEGNQETAMRLWTERGNSYCYFALLLNHKIYLFSYIRYQLIRGTTKKSLNEEEIKSLPTFERIFTRIEQEM